MYVHAQQSSYTKFIRFPNECHRIKRKKKYWKRFGMPCIKQKRRRKKNSWAMLVFSPNAKYLHAKCMCKHQAACYCLCVVVFFCFVVVFIKLSLQWPVFFSVLPLISRSLVTRVYNVVMVVRWSPMVVWSILVILRFINAFGDLCFSMHLLSKYFIKICF